MASSIYRSTLSSKGQVTIPGPLRRRLGLAAGSVLEFEDDSGRLLVRKAWNADPVAAVTGILEEPADVDAFIEELRGPAE